MMGTLDQPVAVRAMWVLLAAAPVSLALGLPFPLGLTQIGDGRMLPWAWGLNGAFSVVATPLAGLMSRDIGFSSLLIAAAVLYSLAFLVLPVGARLSRRAPSPVPDTGASERLEPFPVIEQPA